MSPSCACSDAHCCDVSLPSSSSRGLLRRDRASTLRGPPRRLDYRATNEENSASGCNLNGLLRLAALELAAMRDGRQEPERSFPPACLHLLHVLLPGNARCHDCQTPAAGWASVSYGICLCLECSGRHRGLGVGTSFVKSLTLDSWKAREVLCMLEGGNAQLRRFFDRHGMGGGTVSGGACASEVGGIDRYRTKAASFYRQHLASHARRLAEREELYEGREAIREKVRTPSPPSLDDETGRRKPVETPTSHLFPSVTAKHPPGPVCEVVGVR